MRALAHALSGRVFHGHLLPLRLFGLVSCLVAALATAGCQMMPQGRGVPEPVQAVPPPPPPPAAETRPIQPEPPVAPPARAFDGKVRIGLLLPLSGPQSALGTALLEAAQLAVFELADDRFMLIVRDTGTTPESAVGAAESALAAGAMLILGPLQGAFTREIAPVARRSGVNVISFSNDATVAGEGVYLLGAAPEEQVNRVVTYAAERGLKRIAAIVPDDAYGSLVARTFQEVAARTGIQIVAIEATSASGENLSRVLQRLTRYEERRAKAQQAAAAAAAEQPAADQAAAGPAAEPSPPRPQPPETTPAPFDAILVAGGIERSRELATYLTYFDAASPGVRLLGTSLWAGANLMADRSLHGAWFPGTVPEARERFEARFHQAFAHAPARFASLAYDATAIAALLARSATGAPDYGESTLKSPQGFIGAEGLFRFRKDGIAERSLAVFEITSIGPVIVSEPPVQFEASN